MKFKKFVRPRIASILIKYFFFLLSTHFQAQLWCHGAWITKSSYSSGKFISLSLDKYQLKRCINSSNRTKMHRMIWILISSDRVCSENVDHIVIRISKMHIHLNSIQCIRYCTHCCTTTIFICVNCKIT